MSVDIYPAFKDGNNIEHADDWNPDSTMNLANMNFYQLAEDLGLSVSMTAPGHIRVRILRAALKYSTTETRYHERLKRICAIAELLKVPFIAFA